MPLKNKLIDLVDKIRGKNHGSPFDFPEKKEVNKPSSKPAASSTDKVFQAIPTEKLETDATKKNTNGQTIISNDEPPATATLNLVELLKNQLLENASDLHINTNLEPFYRNNRGHIQFLSDKPPVSDKDIRTVLLASIGENKFTNFLQTNEFDSAQQFGSVGRFRINISRDINGIAAVFRKIPFELPTIESIDLPEKIVNLICNAKSGLVLVTGQNETGKTTTVTALVNHINETRRANILMLEDPIEFIHPRKQSAISQREIGKHSNSYAESMKHALRQDVDVVVVGEMRDLETISAAVGLAEAGYLVLATLHTRNALESVERITDVYPPEKSQLVRVQLSLMLRCVLSQKLLPTKDNNGRIICREIMIPNDGIRNIIRQGKTEMLYSALETSQSTGNILFDTYLKALLEQDLITPETVQLEAHHPDDL